MGEAFLADGLRKTSHRGEEPTFTAPRTAEGGCGGESWTAGGQNLTIVHQT